MTFEHCAGKKLDESRIQEAKNLGGLNNDWDLTEYLLSTDGVTVDKTELIEYFQNVYWNDGEGLINHESLLINPETLE